MFGTNYAAMAAALTYIPTYDFNRPGYTSPTTYANRRASKTYQSNGKRECARRLRQWARIEERRAA